MPVVELLQHERDHSVRFRGILVHIISNGSCLILNFGNRGIFILSNQAAVGSS